MKHNLLASKKASIIVPLQGLRGLSFMGIFLSHTGISLFSSLGPGGVSVFLILSGFLMTMNYFEKSRIEKYSMVDNIKFAWSKIKRLYPLHVVTMIIAIPLAVKGISTSGIGSLLIKIALSITLLQSFVPDSAVYYSLNAVAWYLSVCKFIYFCFPWILRLCEKYNTRSFEGKGIVFIWLILVLISFLASKVDVSISDGFTKWFVYVFPMTRLIDFISGCFLGVMYIKRDAGSYKMTPIISKCIIYLSLILIIIACITFTVVNPDDLDLRHPELWWRYTVIFLIPNAMLIYMLALHEDNILTKVLSTKLLIWIGNLSGSAFLIHQLVLRYCNIATGFLKLNGTVWMIFNKIIIPFLITIAACVIWEKLAKIIRFKH